MFRSRRSAITAAVLAAAGILVATAAYARPGPGGGSFGGSRGGYGGYANPGFSGYSGNFSRGGYGSPEGYSGYGFPGGNSPGFGGPGYAGPGYGGYPGYNAGGGGYPGNGGFAGTGGYPGNGRNPGNGGYGGNYTGNNNNNNNPYIVVPYPIGNGGGNGGGGYSGNNGYGGGNQYGSNGAAGAGGASQRSSVTPNGTYLYGQEGSLSFYATPPGNSAPVDPAPASAPADTSNYYTPDAGSSPAPAPATLSVARVLVRIPPEAHLWFEGVETRQSGTERTFKSTALEPGRPYLYDVKARWWQDGKPVEKIRTLTVWAGSVVNVDLTAGD